MSITITGKVLNASTYMGMKDIPIALVGPNQNIQHTLTDPSGTYIFTNLTLVGDYKLYELVTDLSNPILKEPLGYNSSLTPHCYTFTLTETTTDSLLTYDFKHSLDTPFEPSSSAYLLETTTYELYSLNLITGTQSYLCKLPQNIKPGHIVYHDPSQFLYFYDLDSHQLCKITSEGLIIPYVCPTLPANDFSCATMTADGLLFLYANENDTIYSINLCNDSLNFLQVQTHSFPAITANSLCIHPSSPYFYSLNAEGQLIEIHKTNATSSVLTTNHLPPLTHYDLLFDFDGMLYIISYTDHTIYRCMIEGHTATCQVFAKLEHAYKTAYVSRSLLAPLTIALGTAPAPYLSTLEQNGPRHGQTQLLSLSPPSQLPAISLADKTYTLPLTINNQTGKTAYLYAWIDWNQNGDFEKVEGIESLPVSSISSVLQKISLSFKLPENPIPLLGETYMRLRITTDSLPIDTHNIKFDSRSIGPASDGDIIDLMLLIDAPPPTAPEILYFKGLVGELTQGTCPVTDPTNGLLTYTLDTPPLYGKVTLNKATGNWTYLSTLDTNGEKTTNGEKPTNGEDSFKVCATSSISHLSCIILIKLSLELADLTITFMPNQEEFTHQDVLTFTATLYNTGSITLDHPLFTCIPPEGFSFMNGSTTINGVKDLSCIPEFGISLYKILPNEKCNITFSLIPTLILPEVITPTCTLKATYSLNSELESRTFNITQVALPCHLKNPKLSLTLDANTSSAFLEDLVQYTIHLTNTGDLPLEHINLSLALPLEMQYKGDLTLDYTPLDIDLQNGYCISTLPPNASHALHFKASPTTTSTLGQLTTLIFADYSYTLNNTQKTCKDLTASHVLTLYEPAFTLSKYTNQSAVNPGDIFTYHIQAENTGEVPIQEVILKETLPEFLKVISITQDLIPLSNTLKTGLSIGNLAPHTSKCIEISLQVVKDCTAPILNYPTLGIFKLVSETYEKVFYLDATDTTDIYLSYPKLSLNKHTTTTEYIFGDTITYEILIENIGTLPLSHIKISDMLAPELKFIEDSMELDHMPMPHTSIISGITLDTLPVGHTKTLSLKALIIDTGRNNTIETTTHASYNYKLLEHTPEKIGFTDSPTHVIHIINPSLLVTGSVTPQVAYLHDQLDYHIEVINDGDVDAFQVTFKNTCNCAKLIEGSFKINDKVINSIALNMPIPIGTIPKKEKSLITFSLEVMGGLHHEDVLENEVFVQFMYHTHDNINYQQECTPLKLSSPLMLSTFKQIDVEDHLELTSNKPDVELINNIGGQVKLLKSYIIETPKGTSLDGQTLTGSKLIIHAYLDLTVEYTSSDTDSKICTANYCLPFSTFIILPETVLPNTPVHIDSNIENIFYRVVNNRCFFVCTSLLVIAHLN